MHSDFFGCKKKSVKSEKERCGIADGISIQSEKYSSENVLTVFEYCPEMDCSAKATKGIGGSPCLVTMAYSGHSGRPAKNYPALKIKIRVISI